MFNDELHDCIAKCLAGEYRDAVAALQAPLFERWKVTAAGDSGRSTPSTMFSAAHTARTECYLLLKAASLAVGQRTLVRHCRVLREAGNDDEAFACGLIDPEIFSNERWERRLGNSVSDVSRHPTAALGGFLG